MNQQDVIEFFDRLAPGWDAGAENNEQIIRTILDGALVRTGVRVLDVACGTGVMIPYYLQRNVRSVTAIDIAPQMAKIAREKFPLANVAVLCGDVETTEFSELFDCIVVYNAFPHFPDPARLIQRLSGLLAPGGTLTVAHGMSRSHIDAHHRGPAAKVSIGLIHENELAEMMGKHLNVFVKRSDDTMYQVSAERVVPADKRAPAYL